MDDVGQATNFGGKFALVGRWPLLVADQQGISKNGSVF